MSTALATTAVKLAPSIANVLSSNATASSEENVANINKETSEYAVNAEKEATAAREAAYNAMKTTGATNQTTGEAALTTEANTPNAALEQETKDIAGKTAQELQEGAGQMAASLAGQGVRGGQAATLINRGIGGQAIQAQYDVNKLKAEDEAQRQADLRAYQALKAGRGQTAAQGAITF